MAKGNILKEAIADAKAVRDVALANAKAALEEAFTPKLQNMLSARLSEDLEEEMELDIEDDNIELGEMGGEYEEENSMDEEIDLEEILNELELEEGDDSEDEELEEHGGLNQEKPNYTADQMHKVKYSEKNIYEKADNKEFDLDALLNEINSLETEQVAQVAPNTNRAKPIPNGNGNPPKLGRARTANRKAKNPTVGRAQIMKGKKRNGRGQTIVKPNPRIPRPAVNATGNLMEKKPNVGGCRSVRNELQKLQEVLDVKTKELNEVNLINSKLLYVNRIFKANQLDDGQKLRVVETLDKADSAKEAKLIYETIKDTFNVAKSKKASVKKQTKTIKENFRGMASKSAGISRTKKAAPKRAIISESDNMVHRFQKLANIKINQ